MATTYKSAGPGPRRPRTPPEPAATSFSRALGESAQQVWLAGLGALGRAQREGGRLFDALVREGRQLDRDTRRRVGEQADEVRDNVEFTLDQAREQVSSSWERLERAFDERLQRALHRLGAPTRNDVAELNARIDALTAELRAQRRAARRTPPRKNATARRAPAGPPAQAAAPAPAPAAAPPVPPVPPAPGGGDPAA